MFFFSFWGYLRVNVLVEERNDENTSTREKTVGSLYLYVLYGVVVAVAKRMALSNSSVLKGEPKNPVSFFQ